LETWNANKIILVRTGVKNVVNEYVVVIVEEEERVEIAEYVEECVKRFASGMPPGSSMLVARRWRVAVRVGCCGLDSARGGGIFGDGVVGTLKTREFRNEGLGKQSSLSGGYLDGKEVDYTHIHIVSRREE